MGSHYWSLFINRDRYYGCKRWKSPKGLWICPRNHLTQENLFSSLFYPHNLWITHRKNSSFTRVFTAHEHRFAVAAVMCGYDKRTLTLSLFFWQYGDCCRADCLSGRSRTCFICGTAASQVAWQQHTCNTASFNTATYSGGQSWRQQIWWCRLFRTFFWFEMALAYRPPAGRLGNKMLHAWTIIIDSCKTLTDWHDSTRIVYSAYLILTQNQDWFKNLSFWTPRFALPATCDEYFCILWKVHLWCC